MTNHYIISIDSLITTFSRVESGKEFDFSIKTENTNLEDGIITAGDKILATVDDKIYYNFVVKEVSGDSLTLKKTFEIEKSIDTSTDSIGVFYPISKEEYDSLCAKLFYDYSNFIVDSEHEENRPEIKQIDFNKRAFHEKTKKAGLIFSEKIVTRFVASLCTKPFVICTGLSGSGKTKLAQAFVQWICESEEQYKIIPVGADWTNREPLLGFPNGLDDKEYVTPDSGALQLIIKALKPKNKNKPYFLILDEMNLSHVERYFADFLSIMESKDRIRLHSETTKSGISGEIEWPKNLFIIGTVNIDETTYMFSPKVLDRANVIEFRISEEDLAKFIDSEEVLDMKKFIDEDEKIGWGANMAKNFCDLAMGNASYKIDNKNILLNFFRELQKAGAEFGYRTTFEINRLISLLISLTEDDKTWDGIGINPNDFIDIAIMQKLLPKLHGSRNKLTKILPVLGGFCLEDSSKIKENYFEKLSEIEFNTDTNIIYRLSFEKICRMYKNALENGYASFAEA